MSSNKPESEALTLLRAIFDLGEADLRVTIDLLARLGGHSQDRVETLVHQLRRARLVQETGVGLTMVGLAAAVALPEFEPAEECAPGRRPGLCAA